MKKDNIEDFIEANLDSFYDESPPQGTWEKIGEKISAGKKQSVPFSRYMRLTAAAFILVAITFAATRYFILNNIVFKGSALSTAINSNIENIPDKKVVVVPVNEEHPVVQKKKYRSVKTGKK